MWLVALVAGLLAMCVLILLRVDLSALPEKRYVQHEHALAFAFSITLLSPFLIGSRNAWIAFVIVLLVAAPIIAYVSADAVVGFMETNDVRLINIYRLGNSLSFFMLFPFGLMFLPLLYLYERWYGHHMKPIVCKHE